MLSIKQTTPSCFKSLRLLVITFMIVNTLTIFSQTPGVIFEGIVDPDNGTVLDPNGDGYVSKDPLLTPSQFVNTGFPANVNDTDVFDVLYSELPYVGIPEIVQEPTGDLNKGPNCAFTDLVQDANSRSTYYYSDGTNMLFRFRLGGAASNSKGYSILIDTDEKMGFSGPNKDPNAVVGNPGFEIEIVLRTNFSIDVYNVDGTTDPGAAVGTAPFSTNAIKSLALSTVCGDPDYFYDFYIPFSSVPGIDSTTKLRMVSITSINPKGSIGSNGTSDIAGVDDQSGTKDSLFTGAINTQTPTNGDPIERAACPQIDSGLLFSSTTISGTSTEEVGTNIQVFKTTGSTTTSLGTVQVTAGSPNIWSLSSVSIATGDIITATATVPSTVASGVEKGTSTANCNPVTVLESACTPPATPVNVGIGGKGGKEIQGTIAGLNNVSVVIEIFNNGVKVLDWGNAAPNDNSGNFTTTISGTGTWAIDGGGGYKASSGYYSVIITPLTGGSANCPSAVSNSVTYCTTTGGGDGINSGTITFATPATVLTTTSLLSGVLGNTNATTVKLFKNDAFTGFSTSVSGTTAWSIDISSLTLVAGDVLYVTNKENSATCTSLSTTKTVIEKSLTPIIDPEFCVSGPLTTVTGTSSEIGGTIRVYSKGSDGVTTGDTLDGNTATVGSDGNWSLNLASPIAATNFIAATVQNGSETISDISSSIQIKSKTPVTSLAITTATITEGDATLAGNGAPANAIIQLYLDDAKAVNSSGNDLTTTADGSGNWTFTGLDTPLVILYTDAVVTVTATASGVGNCESDQSSSKVVVCNPPTTPVITSTTTEICLLNTITVNITSTQQGVAYQLVNQDNITVGPTLVGNGSAQDIKSDPLDDSTTALKVRASKFLGTCTAVESNTVSFIINPAPGITLGANPSTSFSGSEQTVNLSFSSPVNSPNEYKIDFDNGAFTDVTYTTLPTSPSTLEIPITVPAGLSVGVYKATLTIKEPTKSCETSYPITITITDGTTPTISLSSIATVCSGTSSVNLAYSGTTNTPTKYSINFTDEANLKGFADVEGANLPTTPIVITIPTNTTGGTFNGILVVETAGGIKSIEYPIEITIQYTNPGSIAGDQIINSGTTAVAFTSTEAATGTGGVSYQWQISTTNATTGFSNISGATSATYTDPNNITQTTYYKRIATSTTNSCAAESNVITVNVLTFAGTPMITQVYQSGDERWIEITNIHPSNTVPSGSIKVVLFRDKTNIFDGTSPDATFTLGTTLASGASVLIKNTLSSLSPITGSPTIDNNLTDLEGGNDIIILTTATDDTAWANRYDIVTNIPNKTSPVRIDEVKTTNKNYTEGEWVKFIDDGLSTAFNNFQRHPNAPLISEVIETVNATANVRLGVHNVDPTTRTAGSFNNGYPDRSRYVIINENYEHTGVKLNARKLEVQGTNKLTVTSQPLLITNNLNIADNAEVRLAGSSQLIQTHTGTADISGNGKLYAEQNSTVASIYRYNYMSSPVTTPSLDTYSIETVLKDGTNPVSATGVVGQGGSNIARNINFVSGFDGSTGTPINIADYWIYTFASANGIQSSYVQKLKAGTINPGDGFLIKGPGVAQNYTFVGNPNDGAYTTSVGGGESYLLGNPFASSLNGVKFLQDNLSSLDGNLYFWDHIGEEISSGEDGHLYNGYIGGYATLNLSMSVSAVAKTSTGAYSITIEAENATTTGTSTSGNGGNVVVLDANQESLQFNSITKATDVLKITYSSASEKSLVLKVNGSTIGTYALPASGAYTTFSINECIGVGSEIILESTDTNSISIDNIIIEDADGDISCAPSTGTDASNYTTPGRYVAIGQGFFIGGDSDGGTIVFNNSQREFKEEGTGINDAVFFKANKKTNINKREEESSFFPIVKLGMDFINADGLSLHRQIGISFAGGNTFGFEKGFDSPMFDLGATDLYWKFPNDDNKYVIAGVGSITNDLEVPLEIVIGESGSIVITVDEIENITRDLFIKDKLTGETYEISEAKSYGIPLDKGTYSDRFVLTFSKITLSTDENILQDESLLEVYVNNNENEIIINTLKNIQIQEVKLYSLLGKTMQGWSKNLNNKKENRLSLIKLPKGVYIVNITTDKNTISKKVIIE